MRTARQVARTGYMINSYKILARLHVFQRMRTFGITRNRWGGMLAIIQSPLFPHGKSPRYPLDRRLGEPQSWWCRENFPASAGNRIPII